MPIIEKKLYPTAENCQLQGDQPIAVRALIGMLQGMEKFHPGCKVSGWPAGPVELFEVRESTPLEDATAKLDSIRDTLLAAGRDPLPAEVVAAILLRL